MKILRRAAAVLASTAAFAAIASPASAVDELARQSITNDLICHRAHTATPGPANVQGVEVCTPVASAETAFFWEQYDVACPTCVAIYTPAAWTTVKPVVIRIWVNGGLIQQQYPFGTASLGGPTPFCVASTHPATTAPCLV